MKSSPGHWTIYEVPQSGKGMGIMKTYFQLTLITLLFLTSCLLLTSQAESTPAPLPSEVPLASSADRSKFKVGLVPEYHHILDELPYTSSYSIHLLIADNLYEITGSETVVYFNAEDVPLNEVNFRLFPNLLGGKMKAGNLSVDGEGVTAAYSLHDSLMTIPLKTSLQPGQSITLRMDFEISIPQSVSLNYGVQAYYDNVLALAHAYPMIAVYDDEGWNAEIPPQSGDVTYADISFFTVTVDAPKNLVVAGTGVEVSRQNTGNRQTVRYEAGPVRDFYLAASPDYQVFVRESNGVTIRFYTRGNLQAGAEFALDVAVRAVEIFEKRYAPYPYTELDFVSTPTLALGIEYPGIIAMTESLMEPGNAYLEATVVHEVAHQWFYNLVGNDQLDDPWLDESLAQFATLQYYVDEYGEAGKEAYLEDIEGRWAYIENERIPVGLPVRAYSYAEYSGIVYGRGALFFIALREEMGTRNFDDFLRAYVKNNAWNIGTTEVLKAEAEAQCACDLTVLFDEWVYP